jgi:hypothetical protein
LPGSWEEARKSATSHFQSNDHVRTELWPYANRFFHGIIWRISKIEKRKSSARSEMFIAWTFCQRKKFRQERHASTSLKPSATALQALGEFLNLNPINMPGLTALVTRASVRPSFLYFYWGD